MCQRRRAEQLRRTAARRSVGGLGIHWKVKTPLACRNQGAKWQKIKPAARSELGSIWPCAKDVLDSLQRIPSVLQKTINLACAFWRPMFLFHDTRKAWPGLYMESKRLRCLRDTTGSPRSTSHIRARCISALANRNELASGNQWLVARRGVGQDEASQCFAIFCK